MEVFILLEGVHVQRQPSHAWIRHRPGFPENWKQEKNTLPKGVKLSSWWERVWQNALVSLRGRLIHRVIYFNQRYVILQKGMQSKLGCKEAELGEAELARGGILPYIVLRCYCAAGTPFCLLCLEHLTRQLTHFSQTSNGKAGSIFRACSLPEDELNWPQCHTLTQRCSFALCPLWGPSAFSGTWT